MKTNEEIMHEIEFQLIKLDLEISKYAYSVVGTPEEAETKNKKLIHISKQIKLLENSIFDN